MRRVTLAFLVALAAAAGLSVVRAAERDLGREVLGPTDGWGAFGTGTTGGANAEPSQVYVVQNRSELIAALNNGVFSSTSPSNPSNEPKIIYVTGTIDANVDDGNQPLGCEDYYRNGYTPEAYFATYDPEVWGRTDPSGPLEDARLASHNAQQARVRIRIGSNTTIVGVGQNAVIRGAWFDIRGTGRRNIIVRNITFLDTYDCFPEWSPTDGSLGSWNASYDAISVRDGANVWIDHNWFEDRDTADSTLPQRFGVIYQVHDGLVDITNAADLLTVSWNRFRNHDKTMLIGSSDSATSDRGHLRVTLHHNSFENVGQRAPRVRYGQVHVYDNYYAILNPEEYGYSWGVGIESAIYAQNNFFRAAPGVTPERFIGVFKGTAIHATGTLVNGLSPSYLADVVGAFNAANDPDLGTDVGWTPTLYTTIDGTPSVPGVVPLRAGPINW